MKATLSIIFIGAAGLVAFQNCAPQRLQSDFDTLVNGASQNQSQAASPAPGSQGNTLPPRSIGQIPGVILPTPPATPSPNPGIPVYGGGGGTTPTPTPTPTPSGPTTNGCLLPSNVFNEGYSAPAAEVSAATTTSNGSVYLRMNSILNLFAEQRTHQESCRDYYTRVTRQDFEIGEGSYKAGADRVFVGRLGKAYRCTSSGLLVENTEQVANQVKSCDVTYCNQVDAITGRVKYYFPGDHARNISKRPTTESGKCRIESQPYYYFIAVNYQCVQNGATAQWQELGTEMISNNILYENAQTVIGTNYGQTTNPSPNDTLQNFFSKNTSAMISAFFPACPFTAANSVVNDDAKDVKFGLVHGGYSIQSLGGATRVYMNQLATALTDKVTMYTPGLLNLTMTKLENGVYSGMGTSKPDNCSNHIPFLGRIIRRSEGQYDYTVTWMTSACGITANTSQTLSLVIDPVYSNISTTVAPPPPPAPAPAPTPDPTPPPYDGGGY